MNIKNSFKQALWLVRKESLDFNFSKTLLVVSLSLGVAALVALECFTQRIENTIQRDAKSILAADLQIQSWRPFTEDIFKALESLDVTHSHRVYQKDFVSSLRHQQQTITISCRTLDGDQFPFYGNFLTDPGLKVSDLASERLVLLDKSLKNKNIQVGDEVQIGKALFKVAGFILEEPQSVAASFSIGPRVIFHNRHLAATGLDSMGSRVFHQLLVRTPTAPESFKTQFRNLVPDPHWRIITPQHANRQASKVLDRLRAFLSFVAVTALLLGALGTYSVFRSIFLRKIDDYLTLRCLGFSSRTIEIFSLFQSLPIVLGGFIIGSAIGWLLEWGITKWATDALQMSLADISRLPSFAWAILLTSFSVILAIYFPTKEALKVPVSQVMRSKSETQNKPEKKGFIILFFLVSVLIFLITRNIKFGSAFISGVFVSAVLFFVLGWLIQKWLPLFSENISRFSLKSGFRLFSRGGAQSQLAIFTLGFSVFLMGLVSFVGDSLTHQIDIGERKDVPNVYFMSVPMEANEKLIELYPEISLTPVIQARIESINNQDITTDKSYSEDETERFFQTREYFITKRLDLAPDEVLTQGDSMFGDPSPNQVRISLEESFASRMGIKVGDVLKLEISGVPLITVVQSLRKVSWLNLKPNFFIVAHPDDIEGAPFDSIGLYRAQDASIISNIQAQVAALFPQITVIDGESLSQRLTTVIDQLSTSVTSLSLFCLASSLFVFMGLALSRRTELQNAIALWKCLGAPKAFILSTYLTESISIALSASALGLLIAWFTSYGLSVWVLDITIASPNFLRVLTLLSLPLIVLVGFQVLFIRNLYEKLTQDLFREL